MAQRDDPRRVSGKMTYEQIEHELKTPLASMRSLSEIVRDHPDLSDDQRRRFWMRS